MIPGTLQADAYVYIRADDTGLRLRRKRRGSLMTDIVIPASAISGHYDVPDELMEVAHFRRWMGQKTYLRRK